MAWYAHPFQNFPQFIVIHTVKNFGIVNKGEIYIFLELSCFFDDPADVGNLISGSSAFSKTNLNNWKFTVRVFKKAYIFGSLKIKYSNSISSLITQVLDSLSLCCLFFLLSFSSFCFVYPPFPSTFTFPIFCLPGITAKALKMLQKHRNSITDFLGEPVKRLALIPGV